MENLKIYRVKESKEYYGTKISKGRYIAFFYWNGGWHTILVATPTEPQLYLGSYNTYYDEEINIEDIKWVYPHLHRGIRQILSSGDI